MNFYSRFSDAIGFTRLLCKLPDERILLNNDACLITIPKFKLRKNINTKPKNPPRIGQGQTTRVRKKQGKKKKKQKKKKAKEKGKTGGIMGERGGGKKGGGRGRMKAEKKGTKEEKNGQTRG